MQKLQVEGNVGWIQQHILVRLVAREERVAISEAGGINLRKLSRKVTGIVCLYSTFGDLMMTVLNFSIAFQKKDNQKLVLIRIVDIVKDMMGSHFLTEMSARSYH